ncbi:MAG TPA: glutamine--fructose-6-phosphate transaminase (isomerizing), partial [Beijerinckiaceae bacterium]|nr:glutamine--fructose-6-phosphate transaminase (isomerizing) [Beijerinckiaceae bacterium]
MCGIVGILGKGAVAPQVVDALKRLEYRGYDSAGVATLENGRLERRRAEGKLRNLELRLSQAPLSGAIGIGHTRWATHGRPNETNAHPHATDKLAVVHNGIIENFRELKAELEASGVRFETETDTEIVAQLVTKEMRDGRSPVDAVAAALPRLRGAFALAFLFKGEEDLLIGARNGPPLAVGYGDGEMYLGSDALALAPFTDEITYLEEGDWAVLSRTSVVYRDASNRIVERPRQKIAAGSFLADRGNYRHFMAKEIHEQPEVVGRTLAHYIDMAASRVCTLESVPFDWKALPRISIVACGTAYLAGLTAKYWFERLARLPVEVDVASEFRYREAPLDPGGLMIVVSQSGETADTLACLRYAKACGQHVLSVVNVPTSTIARESTVVTRTLAGPEIGVASTKAFTCQLAVLLCLAMAAGRARGALSDADERALVDALIAIPGNMVEALRHEHGTEQLARELSKATDVLYLGRGTSYPLAMEGALKLKEISYIHAEGYPAGEMKHGPIALIDENMPVVAIAPDDHVFDKMASNVQEVKARGGSVIAIVTSGDPRMATDLDQTHDVLVAMPRTAPLLTPIVMTIPLQLLAYHIAVRRGCDVD